jgi:hypothetical protein
MAPADASLADTAESAAAGDGSGGDRAAPDAGTSDTATVDSGVDAVILDAAPDVHPPPVCPPGNAYCPPTMMCITNMCWQGCSLQGTCTVCTGGTQGDICSMANCPSSTCPCDGGAYCPNDEACNNAGQCVACDSTVTGQPCKEPGKTCRHCGDGTYQCTDQSC